ncbi:helix-turn-helix transcriptional regulator [Luteolibacter pohnpeiensis]|uniref:Helix-turn-helix transcriptional regulator n=1 Tax=Luteolibacter pohnpeiensis TaxID=454153 RepID=A0A934VSV1_9BACT|nr:AraC family transcriptional regulator [Luteolibacter pohnpeiensis]MBK1880807.1 helix-turn-helix transcriptional regulator [Luteolibacter pohnpeiensis]
MDADRDFPGVVSFPEISTPLGSFHFGGHLSNVGGTGFQHFRTYGNYALVLVTGRGSGRFRDQLGTDRRITAGDLLLIFPEIPHQYGPEAGDFWEEIFLTFDGAAFDEWRNRGLNPSQPIWQLPSPESWQQRFRQLLDMRITTLAEACLAVGTIHTLVAEALAQHPQSGHAGHWVDSATQMLGMGRGAPSLEQIARQLGMGYETFRKKYKAATGESPGNCRRRLRLVQAARMIQSEFTLDLVADALDFCDAFHLSKSFKRHFGFPPAELRKRGKDGASRQPESGK